MPEKIFSDKFPNQHPEGAYLPDFFMAVVKKGLKSMMPGELGYTYPGELTAIGTSLYLDVASKPALEPKSKSDFSMTIPVLRLFAEHHDGYVLDMRRIIAVNGLRFLSEDYDALTAQDCRDDPNHVRVLAAIFKDPAEGLHLVGRDDEQTVTYCEQLVRDVDHIYALLELNEDGGSGRWAGQSPYPVFSHR